MSPFTPRGLFLHSDFFTFFILHFFTFFTFLHFYNFQIFSSKAVGLVWVTPLTFLHFYKFFHGHSSSCFFFMWGDAKKIFLEGGGPE